MLKIIKNLTVVEFSNWWQRANGYRAETDNYWEQKQREIILFLEQVQKNRSS